MREILEVHLVVEEQIVVEVITPAVEEITVVEELSTVAEKVITMVVEVIIVAVAEDEEVVDGECPCPMWRPSIGWWKTLPS